MSIQSGFTPIKRTIFIRTLDNEGILFNKRVVKGMTQYDTAFDNEGKMWMTLITDKLLGNQMLINKHDKGKSVEYLDNKSKNLLKRIKQYFQKMFVGYDSPEMNAALKEINLRMMFK